LSRSSAESRKPPRLQNATLQTGAKYPARSSDDRQYLADLTTSFANFPVTVPLSTNTVLKYQKAARQVLVLTMIQLALVLLISDLATVMAIGDVPSKTANFSPAQSPLLVERQSCIPNTYLCSTSLGSSFAGICCAIGQTCALDANNNPACCPSGHVSHPILQSFTGHQRD